MSRKPLWSEGVLVSQHHFQAQDRYHELLVRDRIASIRRFDWGILELEVDERLLQAGQFRLQHLTAVWPDGLLVRCGARSEVPAPEARSFEGLFPSDARCVTATCGTTPVWIVRDGDRWLMFAGTRTSRRRDFASPFRNHAERTAEAWYGQAGNGWRVGAQG